jgi:hypothetical protein
MKKFFLLRTEEFSSIISKNTDLPTFAHLCITLWIDWITFHALTSEQWPFYIHQQPFSGQESLAILHRQI